MKNLIFIMICLVSILLASIYGPEGLGYPFVKSEALEQVFWLLRLPRVLLAFIVGASLGVCGLIFQGIFRNDLAGPYTLGLASGASFGATLGIYLLGFWGLALNYGPFHTPMIFAFIGAVISIFLILKLSKKSKMFNPQTMILSGVILSYIFSSLILLLHFFAASDVLKSMMRWVMGDLSVVGMRSVWILLPWPLLFISYVFFKRGELNLLNVGEVFASTRGLDTEAFRKKIFILSSIVVSAVVCVAGPIGFVGLIFPHISKKIFGKAIEANILSCSLMAGSFLVLSDLICRIIYPHGELPVGIMTSFIGGPFFLWLLIFKSHET